MTKFYVHCENFETNEKKIFIFDNDISSIKDEHGEEIDLTFFERYKIKNIETKEIKFSKDTPITKSKHIRCLKIQLGMKCNYTCDYCSQSSLVEGSIDFTPKNIDNFISKLSKLDLSDLMRIEFWGGEPFVYWKTIKKLTKKLYEINPNIVFVVVTNGSLLTDEIIDFLDQYNFSVGFSHDGPGQKYRGPDPLDNTKQKNNILKLFNKLHPKKRFFFNSMLHKFNLNRKEILNFFINVTGCQDVKMGESVLITTYDSGSKDLSLYDYQDMIKFRRNAISDLSILGKNEVRKVNRKIIFLIESIVNHKKIDEVHHRCDCHSPYTLPIDMMGNVLSCHNVNANSISDNGESHCGGNINDIENVKIKTGTHVSLRKECQSCPVIHSCRGPCFYVDGENWEISCDSSYNDNIVIFAYVFKLLTGFTPMWIEDFDGKLPDWRKDIFGNYFPNITRKQKRVIPIAQVT